MLLFSNKTGLTAHQVLLNTRVISYFEGTQYFITVCKLKARIIICIFSEVQFYILLLLETNLGTWQFSPFLLKLDLICFTAVV